MHPQNRARVAPARTARPTDRHAVAQLLTERVAEYAGRHLQPAPGSRGRGPKQGHRTKDLKRGRPYAASNLLGVLAESLVDPRVRTTDICALLEQLKVDVLQACGELTDVEFDDAMLRETDAQGATDTRQYLAGRHRTPGTLDALMDALAREIVEKQVAHAAAKRLRDELAIAS